ncbi:MAG TPA: ABC transporter permease [Candidatus Acidoferrales bacterium]|nr:ABC transporter permease [Candidatus Acidoferrales bacterium]
MLTRLRILGSRIAALFSRRRDDDEFHQELASHLAMLTDENIRRGMSPAEAARAARLRLGSDPQLRESHHDLRALRLLETLLQDVRFALRILRKSPGFTAVAILTLALGIGANTAIFSLLDAIMFRTLPVPNPRQLVIFTSRSSGRQTRVAGYVTYGDCPSGPKTPLSCSFSYPLFRQLHSQQQQTGFSAVFTFMNTGGYVSFHGHVSQARGVLVSGDFFPAMSVRAAYGRLLGPTDDSLSAPPAIELSYGYWQREFAGDPAVVGQTIYLNRHPFTVAGIAVRGFFGFDASGPADFWAPFAFGPVLNPDEFGLTDPAYSWLWIAGRVKPGLTIAQAQALIDPLYVRDVTTGPDAIFKPNADPHLVLASAPQGVPSLRAYSSSLSTLMTVVGIVLLIACANIASLTLARSSTRRKELAVRLALGAGRWRLIRQLFTESLLLAAVGGVLGILLAYWAASFVVSFFSVNTKTLLQINVHPDSRILLFAIGVSALSAMLAGLMPAFSGTRVDLTPALKENATTVPESIRGARWFDLGNLLVVAQVALSIVVLAAAGMLVRTLVRAESVNPGLDMKNLLIFGLDATLANLTGVQKTDLDQALQRQFALLPGIDSVTYSQGPPMNQGVSAGPVNVAGRPASSTILVERMQVGPRFFETLRIPLVRGRTFAPSDFLPGASSTPIIVNEAFARKAFGKDNPIGRELSVPQGQIIGVAANFSYHFLNDKDRAQPTLYLPMTDDVAGTFEIRAAKNPKALIPLVREMVARADSDLLPSGITTLTDQVDRNLYLPRLLAGLYSLFGSLALLLASIGLYGLLAYEVSRRTREIGIRVALGASRGNLLRLVAGRGMLLAAAGVALGIAASAGVTRLFAHHLYGVKPTDPSTFAAVSALFLLVALAACYIPARRAMKVDPATAIRCE